MKIGRYDKQVRSGVTQHQFLIGRLELRGKALSQIVSLDSNLQKISESLTRQGHRRLQLRDNITGLQSTLSRANGDDSRRSHEARLNQAEQDICRTESDIESLELKKADYLSERAALEVAASECDGIGIGIEVLKAHQDEIQRLQSELSNIGKLIEQQEGILEAQGAGSEPKIEMLQARREELLADVALGHTSASDIEAVDAELASILQDRDGEESRQLKCYRDACQTASGLRRKHAEGVSALSALEARSPEIVKLYMRQLSHRLAEEYMSHAQDVVAVAQRLYALNKIVRDSSDSGTDALTDTFQQMMLPTFQAPCFDILDRHSPRRGVFFKASDLQKVAEELIAAERELLRSEGIDDLV